jgi:histidyl-tRNA synthetase
MALSGFRDFYPDDCAFRNAMFAKWRDVAHRYGFVEYDGPPLEPLDLFTKKSGQEIVGQLYNFKDKGDRDVALRPEMTPTLARLVTARHKDFKKPLKWFSIPQVYRYERPQKGRGREHYQLNCDIIGEASLEADVELIALVIDVLRAFGLTEKDFVVRLSDRVFWSDFMDAHHVPNDQRYAFIQAIDKSEREPRESTIEKLKKFEPYIERSMEKIEESRRLGEGLADKVFAILDDAMKGKSERLDTVETGLRHRGLGDYVKRDYTVVRGLAYYTGVVFEVFDRTGEFRAIAGGGRYDTLLKNLGGVDLPALGFGMGDVVLGEMLKAKHAIKSLHDYVSAYVVIADEGYRTEAMKVVQRLRDANYRIDYPMAPMKVGKQLQIAEEKGCGVAFIIDAKIQNGLVDAKNLTDRTQSELFADKMDYYMRFEHTLQRERSIKESSPVAFERYKRDILNRAWALTEEEPEEAPPRSETSDAGK